MTHERGHPQTEADILQQEKSDCKYDPTMILRAGYLKIKTKKSVLAPFVPNEVQKKVLAIIRDIRAKVRPVRVCILKGRQFGISTLSEALLYCFTTQRANQNALIMSDDEDGSNYLFEMLKLMYEEMEKEQPHLTPQRKTSNEKKLEFLHKRSQILIDTAKNVDAGRKYTFHLAHLSEASRFRDFDQTLLSLMQSVPDYAETFVLIETTADGENDFFRFWNRIVEESAKGETDWVPLFLSWKDHSEYQKKFVTDAEKEFFVQGMTSEEKTVIKDHGLTLEQMNWRRWAIKNKCGGNIESFHQEYPLTPEEAFRSSGKRVYPESIMAPHKKSICPPIQIGDVELIDKVPTIIPAEDGHLRVYKTPLKDHRYVIGVDTSNGISGSDYACAQVIDRSTWEQVAVLHGNIQPDILGDKLFALGAWYKWAMIAPEVNGSGLVTTLRLRDLFYPKIVRHEKLNIDDVGNVTESEELGWHTNAKTKPVLISDLGGALREMLLVLHDEHTLRELRSFYILDVKDSGNIVVGGRAGSHDDRVMALSIAVHFAKTMPDFAHKNNGGVIHLSNRSTGY